MLLLFLLFFITFLFLAKEVLCTLNPLTIDCNHKRLIKELYQDLNDYLVQEKQNSIIEINSRIVDLLDSAISKQPLPVDFNLDINLQELFKLYNVKFESNHSNVLETICSYIQLWHRVVGIDKFVFIDLKAYLSEQELDKLYDAILYEKIYVFFIESHYEKKLDKEEVKIYDIDKCIIDC